MDQRRGENDKIADNGAKKKNPREPTRSALPIQFKSKIQELSGANSIDGEILVIQKSLTSRDVDDQQGCFFIPSNQIQENYRNCLDSDEVAHLKMGEDRDDVGEDLFFLPVICVEPRLKFSLLLLKRWNPNPASGEDSMCYGLTKNWNDIKSRNNLKMGDVLQLWAVGAGENMWFVLHNLTTAGNETDEEPENNEANNKTSTNLRRTGLPMNQSYYILGALMGSSIGHGTPP
nr:B3 domain-containing protein At3g25182-like [Coffea arabica]